MDDLEELLSDLDTIVENSSSLDNDHDLNKFREDLKFITSKKLEKLRSNIRNGDKLIRSIKSLKIIPECYEDKVNSWIVNNMKNVSTEGLLEKNNQKLFQEIDNLGLEELKQNKIVQDESLDDLISKLEEWNSLNSILKLQLKKIETLALETIKNTKEAPKNHSAVLSSIPIFSLPINSNKRPSIVNIIRAKNHNSVDISRLHSGKATSSNNYYTLKNLKSIARGLNISTSGNKTDLIDKIKAVLNGP